MDPPFQVHSRVMHATDREFGDAPLTVPVALEIVQMRLGGVAVIATAYIAPLFNLVGNSKEVTPIPGDIESCPLVKVRPSAVSPLIEPPMANVGAGGAPPPPPPPQEPMEVSAESRRYTGKVFLLVIDISIPGIGFT